MTRSGTEGPRESWSLRGSNFNEDPVTMTICIRHFPTSHLPHHTTPHYTSPHHTTPHHTTPHHTPPHHTTLHHTTPTQSIRSGACVFMQPVKGRLEVPSHLIAVQLHACQVLQRLGLPRLLAVLYVPAQ